MIVIAVVGMAGSGKSTLVEYLKSRGLYTIRFGQFVVDEVVRRSLPLNSENERLVSRELRITHGMDVFAKLSLPLIEEAILKHDLIVIDGLYSFSEYKILRKQIETLVIIAVFTPKRIRYERLTRRLERPLTLEEAEKRDYFEIEMSEKGGPIALADYTIINSGDYENLVKECKNLLQAMGFIDEFNQVNSSHS